MRDSFGGTFMIQLLLIFIVIYVSFMAVALNYAKAFRVKNGVINILEQQQYDGTYNDPAIDDVNAYLNSIPYKYGSNDELRKSCMNSAVENVDDKVPIFTDNGVCIVPLGESGRNYYKVITYIPIKFDFFNLKFHIAISGETNIIYTY